MVRKTAETAAACAGCPEIAGMNVGIYCLEDADLAPDGTYSTRSVGVAGSFGSETAY